MVVGNQNQELINHDEITLKDIIIKAKDWWNYLLSKWVIILISGLIGGALGLYYAISKKPLYTAITTFVLEDEKNGGGLGNLSGLASMAGLDIGGNGGGIFQGDNILGLYKSRTILEQTLLTAVDIEGKKELLVDRYLEFKEIRKRWLKNPKLSKMKFFEHSILKPGEKEPVRDRLRDSVLGVIIADINKNILSVTKPDKKLGTIQVDVKSNDEIFSKKFNDELVRNVNEFYISTKTKKTFQNVKILERKTDSVRRVMNGAIYTAVQVADETPNLNPTRQVQRVAPAQKAQFSAETNKAILASLVQNLELTKMSLLKETPLIQVIDYPIYPLRKDKLGKAKGIVYGGILGGFLICFILILRRLVKIILL